jgi:hypothetical protein
MGLPGVIGFDYCAYIYKRGRPDYLCVPTIQCNQTGKTDYYLLLLFPEQKALLSGVVLAAVLVYVIMNHSVAPAFSCKGVCVYI